VNEYFQTNNPHIFAIGSACSNSAACKYPPKKLGSLIIGLAFKNKKKDILFPYFLLHSFPEILAFGLHKKEIKLSKDVKKYKFSHGKFYMRGVIQ
jgi:pyruvate/2-oxoglutarate dehydrogenase complex dihydrolipoamide dehydrogenase (E3) component